MSGVLDFIKRWKAFIHDIDNSTYTRDDDRGEDGEGIDPDLHIPSIERYEDGFWCDIPLLHLMPGQYFRVRQTDGTLIMDAATGQPRVFKATSFPSIEVQHPHDPGQMLTLKFAFDNFEEQTPSTASNETPASPAADTP